MMPATMATQYSGRKAKKEKFNSCGSSTHSAAQAKQRSIAEIVSWTPTSDIDGSGSAMRRHRRTRRRAHSTRKPRTTAMSPTLTAFSSHAGTPRIWANRNGRISTPTPLTAQIPKPKATMQKTVTRPMSSADNPAAE